MPKGKTTLVEPAVTEPQEPIVSTGEVSQTEPQADLAQLQAQIEKLKSDIAGEQRARQQQLDKAQELERDLAQAKSDRETQQALMAILAQQQGKSEDELGEEIQAKKPDLLAQFQILTKTQQAQREQDRYNRSANEVWNRLLATGIKEGDDTYFEVRSMLSRGDLDWAKAKVSKIEASKQAETPKAPEVKETEAEMRERIRQELQRESSAFKTETGKPSGTGQSEDEFLKDYSTGKRRSSEDDKRATEIIRRQTGGR